MPKKSNETIYKYSSLIEVDCQDYKLLIAFEKS